MRGRHDDRLCGEQYAMLPNILIATCFVLHFESYSSLSSAALTFRPSSTFGSTSFTPCGDRLRMTE